MPSNQEKGIQIQNRIRPEVRPMGINLSMRYFSKFLAIFVLLTGISREKQAAGLSFRPGKDYALFFAVDSYSPPLMPLQNPIANARQIASVLETRFGFKSEVVENPTAAQIEQKLGDYANRFARNLNGQYPENGQLFIFFSGHGLEAFENGFFMPAGADRNRLRETAIQYAYLRPLIDAIKCRHILVAVDACYSAYFDENFGKKTDFTFRRPGELSENSIILANHDKYTSRLFFTSDAVGDMTPDKSGFAKKLLEGFRTSNPANGFMTSSELFANYVERAQPAPHAGDFGKDEAASAFLFFNTQAPPPMDPAQDVRAWNEAKSANTLESYRNYLRNFAQGEFRELADARIRELEAKGRDFADWQQAKTANTVESYDAYLKNWSAGAYRELAESARQRLVGDKSDDMVLVKGGTFQMGSSEGGSDEQPVHTVTIGNFYLGKYEVTVREFKEFIDASGYRTDAEKDGGSYFWNGKEWEKRSGINWKYDAEGILRPSSDYNHPVIHVSWNDATEYCKWLSQKTGKQYRLPTEAEWEYAAGNGNKHTKYSWGNGNPSGKQGGNVADETGKSKFSDWTIFNGYSDGYVYTAPVGSFNGNELGLYDMTGNVWEWCQDWYESDYYKSSPSSNPKGPATGSSRVIRGGSWRSDPQGCRVAFRADGSPGYRSVFTGFRLSRTL